MGKPSLLIACAVLVGVVYAAVPGDKITNLPGIPNGVTFDMYSGFLDGGYAKNDTDDNIHNFYWQASAALFVTRALHCRFVGFQGQDSPQVPIILWLNGGPGCSSLGGFFTENDQ
mgnify:CR=1 FL=1